MAQFFFLLQEKSQQKTFFQKIKERNRTPGSLITIPAKDQQRKKEQEWALHSSIQLVNCRGRIKGGIWLVFCINIRQEFETQKQPGNKLYACLPANICTVKSSAFQTNAKALSYMGNP